MTLKEALRRALITFVAGATSAPIGAAVFDVSTWQAIGLAGVAAAWNYVGRVAQALKEKFDTNILVEWDDLSPWVDPNREN